MAPPFWGNRDAKVDEDEDSGVEEITRSAADMQLARSNPRQSHMIPARTSSNKGETKTSQRDRDVLTIIDKSVKTGFREALQLVAKDQGVSIEIKENCRGVRMKKENVCYITREWIGTARHYCESSYLSISTKNNEFGLMQCFQSVP